MAEHIVTEIRGAVLRVAMNRPEKKNALTLEMYEQLCAAFDRASKSDDVRALYITGAPGVFTAGNDLGDFMKRPPGDADSPVARFLATLVTFDKPLVAGVDGPAVGLGTTMLLHCDLALATDRARFTLPFTKLGLVPEAASTFLLPRLVGRQRASAWLMLAQPFDAKEALDAGLVYRVVAPAELDQAGEQLAQQMAAMPREALRLTKSLLRQGTEDAVRAAMTREAAVFVERLKAPETAQAIMDFMTKKA
jgi:enoyl-CoA hydratase/carnithine racemase